MIKKEGEVILNGYGLKILDYNPEKSYFISIQCGKHPQTNLTWLYSFQVKNFNGERYSLNEFIWDFDSANGILLGRDLNVDNTRRNVMPLIAEFLAIEFFEIYEIE